MGRGRRGTARDKGRARGPRGRPLPRGRVSPLVCLLSACPSHPESALLIKRNRPQVVAFLSKLAELRSMTPLHPRVTRAMAAAYGLDDATNCEIKCEWLRVSAPAPRPPSLAVVSLPQLLQPRLAHTCAFGGCRPFDTRPPPTPPPAAPAQLCVSANDAAAVPAAVAMVSSVGRMKYLRPLYRALHRSRVGRQAALDAFKEHADKYHPIARKMVAVDLGV